MTAERLRALAAGSLSAMEDRQLGHNARGFLGSGSRVLIAGLAIAAIGGLVALLGTALTDWVVALGAMVATLGGVVACAGLALLLLAAVTHRMARHRPFA